VTISDHLCSDYSNTL